MWDATEEILAGGRARKYRVGRAGRPASYADVLRACREDEAFRSTLTGTLAACPFRAFRWETPPVTAATADATAFEFVLLDAPGLLSAEPDSSSFAEHFGVDGGGDRPGGEGVVAFPNLGGDAVLVVPEPVGPPAAYGHLAAFVRHAPPGQRDALWRAVGEAMAGRLGPAPVWLSTAGMGVPWLHVRLDGRPKYYGHAPYRAGA